MSIELKEEDAGLADHTGAIPQGTTDATVKKSHTTSQQMRSWDAFWFTINATVGPGIFSVTSGIFAITGSVGITFALFIVGKL